MEEMVIIVYLTLDLRRCQKLKNLPKGIRNLRNLRHLNISKCDNLTKMPHGLGKLTNLQTLPVFIVGKEGGGGISELQHLDHIKGQLQILDLENVKDPGDARAANLEGKAGIKALHLGWRGNEMNVDVVNCLVPPPNLRYLKIRNYSANMLPKWLSHPISSEVFLLLLPCLKSLELEGLSYVEEWNIINNVFPSLEKLVICECAELRRVQPHLPSSLMELEIVKCNEELLGGGSLQGLSKLRYLSIWGPLKSSSEASRSWLGLQYLSSLQKLEIAGCDKLNWLPEGVLRLPSLQNLIIRGNYNMTCLDTDIDAEIVRGEGEESSSPQLPQQQQQQQQQRSKLMALFCTSLCHLYIAWCPKLTALPEWVGDLTSLQSLEIYFCKSLAMLPDGLRRLTGLQQLTIRRCSLLTSRCDKETGGQDWHKISHIPHISID